MRLPSSASKCRQFLQTAMSTQVESLGAIHTTSHDPSHKSQKVTQQHLGPRGVRPPYSKPRSRRRQPHIHRGQDEYRGGKKNTESACATSCRNSEQISEHDGYKKKNGVPRSAACLILHLNTLNRKILVSEKGKGKKTM